MGYKNLFDLRLGKELPERIRDIGRLDFSCQDSLLKKLLHGVSLDQPLYRIMSKERFLESCAEGFLSFSNPERWDDPYESALLYGLEMSHHDTDLAHTYRDAVFAQCWSLNAECDGLWRVYVKHTGGSGTRERGTFVQVQTTVRNLLLSILCTDDQCGLCLCGKISYRGKDEILSWMRRLEICGFYAREGGTFSSPFEAVEAYFQKRDSFSYEQEVRLVFVCGTFCEDGRFETLQRGGKYLEVPFNPRCIERVVLDPWTSKGENASLIEDEIRDRCKWCDVRRSDLYRHYRERD